MTCYNEHADEITQEEYEELIKDNERLGEENLKLQGRLVQERDAAQRLKLALEGVVEIGKRDMTNPKYDGYFAAARAALGLSPR